MADVQVSVPDDLLAVLDAEAARRSVTREVLILEAARRIVLELPPKVGSDPLMW
jgi:hypothetical protein